MKPRTVAGVLHKVLSKASAHGYVPRNAATAAKAPTGRSPEMRTWNREQVRAFLDFTREDRLFAAWRLMLTTGMRRGEVLGLRWDDLEGSRISIRSTRVRAGKEVVTGPPKTSAGTRYLALDAATVAILRDWKKFHLENERMPIGPRYVNSGLVFVNPDGSPIAPNRLSIWFRAAVRRAGLPPIRLHDLRHTYATNALRYGTPVKVVSVRLGHTDPAFTLKTYAHALPADDEAAAEGIAAAFE